MLLCTISYFIILYSINHETPLDHTNSATNDEVWVLICLWKICKFLSNKDLNIAFNYLGNIADNYLGKFTKNNKSKPNKYSKSWSCYKFYIGQTGWTFNTKTKAKEELVFSKILPFNIIHLNKNSHSFDHNFQICNTYRN